MRRLALVCVAIAALATLNAAQASEMPRFEGPVAALIFEGKGDWATGHSLETPSLQACLAVLSSNGPGKCIDPARGHVLAIVTCEYKGIFSSTVRFCTAEFDIPEPGPFERDAKGNWVSQTKLR